MEEIGQRELVVRAGRKESKNSEKRSGSKRDGKPPRKLCIFLYSLWLAV